MVYYLKQGRKSQVNMRMRFDNRGNLIVSVPRGTSKRKIDAFIRKNLEWIEHEQSSFPYHSFQTGDRLPFRGQSFELNVSYSDKTTITIDEMHISVAISSPDDASSVRKAVLDFFLEDLKSFTLKRTEYWAEIMNLKVPEIEFGTANSKWGCFYRKQHRMRISAICSILSPELRDLVIAHELCHARISGHSAQFKELLCSYIPNAGTLSKELNKIARTGIQRNLF